MAWIFVDNDKRIIEKYMVTFSENVFGNDFKLIHKKFTGLKTV